MAPTDDKRSAILDAALRLVAERGFHGTAMSRLAREAGVSAGIIYHYFSGKDELLVELYRETKLRLAARMEAVLDPEQPLAEQMRQLCLGAFRHSLENPLESAFLQQFATSPYYTPELHAEVSKPFAGLAERFEQARREGVLKDQPLEVIGVLFFDLASLLAQKRAAGVLRLDDEAVDGLVETLWEAVRC